MDSLCRIQAYVEENVAADDIRYFGHRGDDEFVNRFNFHPAHNVYDMDGHFFRETVDGFTGEISDDFGGISSASSL
jgi:hypothetical protein